MDRLPRSGSAPGISLEHSRPFAGNYQYATESQGLPFNKQHMQPIAPNRMHMHAGMYGQPKGHRGRSYNPGVPHPEYHMDQVDPHMARAHQDLLAQQQQQQQVERHS